MQDQQNDRTKNVSTKIPELLLKVSSHPGNRANRAKIKVNARYTP